MNELITKRKAAGMTQDEFARVLGIGRTTVTMWETGKSVPSADKLPAIARALGCSIDELFSAEEKEAG